MKKSTFVKKFVALFLVVLMSINTFAAVVGDNDGAAFITKGEFDSLKNDFQSQIDRYNSSIDNKIDGAIASYLAGIRMSKEIIVPTLLSKYENELKNTKNQGHLYWYGGTNHFETSTILRCSVDANLFFENQTKEDDEYLETAKRNSKYGNYTGFEIKTINHPSYVSLDDNGKITLSCVPRCGFKYNGVGHNQNTPPKSGVKTNLFICFPGNYGSGADYFVDVSNVFVDRTDTNNVYTIVYALKSHNWSGMLQYQYQENISEVDAYTIITPNVSYGEAAFLRTGSYGDFSLVLSDHQDFSGSLAWPSDYGIWRETLTSVGYGDLKLRYLKPNKTELSNGADAFYVPLSGATNNVYYGRYYTIEGLLKPIVLNKTEVAWLQAIHSANRYYSDGIVLADPNSSGQCEITIKTNVDGYIMFNSSKNADWSYGGKRSESNPNGWKNTDTRIIANEEKKISKFEIEKGEFVYVYYEPDDGYGEIIDAKMIVETD